MSLQTGTTLGPYADTAKIGEGGLGEVYQARDTTLNSDVAMKALSGAFSFDPHRPHDSSDVVSLVSRPIQRGTVTKVADRRVCISALCLSGGLI
jgi:serine/threonine protein kinase